MTMMMTSFFQLPAAGCLQRSSRVILSIVLLVSSLSAQTIKVDLSRAVNTFSPLRALGSTVDRVPSNATDTFFRPDQLKQIQEAGWGIISYRQNTDLFVQAWHWNPKGKWSDPKGQGYFVGDPNPTSEMIRHSYGYQLRHRGFTRNGGSEFDGYSRLDDGDLSPEALEEVRSYKRKIDRRLRSFIQEGIADGSITACDAKIAAFSIAGALNWICQW